MTPVYVTAGTTFFTHSSTLLGRLIRFGETDRGEGRGSTWANHTGVVIQDGWVGSTDPLAEPAVVIEALWYVRKGPLELKGTEARFFQPIPGYDAAELWHFLTEAESFVGDKYGWWKLGFQLADKLIFGGKKVLTTTLHVKNRPICSFLAAFVNQAAQSRERILARVAAHVNRGDNGAAYYAFGLVPQSADPDEMLDYCLDHPAEWQEVLAWPTPPETKAEEATERREARAEEVK